MKHLRLIIALTLTVLAFSCQKPENNGDDKKPTTGTLNVSFELGDKLLTATNKVVRLSCKASSGPIKKDTIFFAPAAGGEKIACVVTTAGSTAFEFKTPKNLVSGNYNVTVKRANNVAEIGSVEVDCIQLESENVCGKVLCDGKPLEGVLLSDGSDFVKTDKDGVYKLKTKKYNKCLFVINPSGYEVALDKASPIFYHNLSVNEATIERADFSLSKVDQTNHIVYYLGDMQIANRTSDLKQMEIFINDFQNEVNANKSVRQYAITLGDMSWDSYWESNKYDLVSYKNTINILTGIPVYHTIGNHDHSMFAPGDYDSVTSYRSVLGPTFFSFNAGDYHYIILDNILCTNTGEGTSASRSYSCSLTKEQLNWLEKDLSYVDKSKNLIITMHAHMYNQSGTNYTKMGADLEKLVADYKSVNVFTGHTHICYNVDHSSTKNIMEHNAGAICGTWWWTGHYTTNMNICKDGSPAGYTVANVSGSNMTWKYKGTDKDINEQFRTYDRNSIKLTAAEFAPKADNVKASEFEKSCDIWSVSNKDNEVYFNIWNYDPKWTIEVTENGSPLQWKKVSVKDPLHLVLYNAKRYNANTNPTADFVTMKSPHMFMVTAKSPNSTLKFKITDRFGNVYTEDMTRPKSFSIAAYN
jgi:DNA repair exonuclease SbcCD nuclease subunit